MRSVLVTVLVFLVLLSTTVGDSVAQRGAILLDRTGSMAGLRCSDAVAEAALDVALFFTTYPTGLMEVWTFAGNTATNVSGGYVGEAAALAAVTSDPVCDLLTPLADAMCRVSSSLFATGDTIKVLYVTTDGGENNSSGSCSGANDADGLAPWDPGSWQAEVLANLVGNAVVSVKFLGPFGGALAKNVGVNPETGASMGVLADTDFFQDLAAQTGGQYEYIPDPPVADVPTLSEWALIVVVALLLATGTMLINRRRTGSVAA